MVLPSIQRVKAEHIRKRCGDCEKRLNEGEIVVDYLSSAYMGKKSYRFVHLKCLYDTAPEDIEFEMIMESLGGIKK